MPARIGLSAATPNPEGLSPSEFARLFAMPAKEAQAYLAGRKLLSQTYDWRDVYADEHAHQFTVSRLARLDLLQSVRDAVTRVTAGDLSRRDFMREVQATLEKSGWWGTKSVRDPATGKVVTTRFTPSRLKLIYDTNTRMSHAAGHWERMERNKATHPYIRYITKRDERVRASHAEWDGLTLPVGHPFWAAHYPPNGWRCRCRAMSMSQREFDAAQGKGWLKTKPPADNPRTWTNPRTGETREIPEGVDPGFDYNVGQAGLRAKARQVIERDKLERAASGDAAAYIAANLTGGDFLRWMAKPKGAYPLVRITDADAALIGANGRIASMSEATAAKQLRAHPELTGADYAAAQSVIDAPTAKVQDTPHSLIYILEQALDQGGGYVLVVKATKTGEGLFVTSYRKLSREEAERQTEIARLLKKGGNK